MDKNKIKSQLRKGFLEYCVLIIISKEDVYSSDILDGLKSANLITVEGTLYPLLSRLKRDKLVKYEWIESKNGPPRKYYNLTDEGKLKLEIYKDSWKEISGSVEFLLKDTKK